MQTLMLLLAGLLLAYDFQNILSWWRGRVITPGEQTSYDFTIIVPLFGHPRYFERRETLTRYQANVLVALETTPAVMAAFADQLEAEGWTVGRYRQADPNPATLVQVALEDVTTTIALRLDADTQLGADLPNAVAAVIESGADLCSVKCEVENTTNVVTKLQQLEYRMAMLSRHMLPWLTSGACFIGRTDALQSIYTNHSLWTPGEDIETGQTATAMRMRVRHCDIVVHTEAPDSWRGLFRQRRLWWAGNFRHRTINLDKNLVHRPVMTVYASAGIWSSIYWKWWQMIDWHSLPSTLPFLWFFYVLVTLTANFKVRSVWMLLFPFYSLLQGMLMPLAGAIYYFHLARERGCWGRYRFGYIRRRPQQHPADELARLSAAVVRATAVLRMA